MNQMTNSVDRELEVRTRDFDTRARQAADKMENLSPTVDRLGQRLRDVEAMLSEGLATKLEVSLCS